MKTLRAFWLLLALLLPNIGASAADPLAQLQQRIAQVPVLRGEFVQDKQVQGFKNPLRSSGNFLIARERGVLWQTRKPFPSELVLTRERILNRRADGSAEVAVDARQQPALRQVNAVMFALLSGDLQALTRHFKASPELLAGQGWRLRLTPRAGTLAKVFVRITLEGERHVRSVEIEESNGDRTRLVFSALRETPAALSPDEAHRFD